MISLQTLQSFWQDFIQSCIDHPWYTFGQILITILLFTNTLTAQPFWSNSKLIKAPNLYTIPLVRYVIPLWNHQYFYFASRSSWVDWTAQAYNPQVFTLRLFKQKYHVVGSRDYINALLYMPKLPLSSARHRILQAQRVFGNPLPSESMITRVDKAFTQFMIDKTTLTKLCATLEANTYNLISPSRSPVDRAQWERNADVKVLPSTSTKPSKLAVSASLPVLIREFAAYNILSTVLGSAFLDHHLDFVENMFAFGRKYRSFMLGWPYWITPGLGPPALAREKCLLALENLLGPLVTAKESDKTAASVLYNVDDIHPRVKSLVQEAQIEMGKANVSRREILREVACEVLELSWLACYDAVTLITWMLIYINSKESNCAQKVSGDVAKIVSVEQPAPTGLAFEDSPKPRFKVSNEKERPDLEELCPTLFKVLVAMDDEAPRLEEHLDVLDDFVLPSASSVFDKDTEQTEGESKEGDKDKAFQVKKGDRLLVAHWIRRYDPHRWDKPDGPLPAAPRSKEFSSKTGSSDLQGFVVQHHCILYIAAALLAMYNFQTEKDDPLENPTSSVVAGMTVPDNSYKVKISRRSVKSQQTLTF